MRPSKLALLALIVCLATIASAQEPEFIPYEDHPSEDGLSGDDLYSRMLENRFSSFEQILSMRSGDSGGNFQEVQLRLRYLSYREPKKKRTRPGRFLSKQHLADHLGLSIYTIDSWVWALVERSVRMS